MFRYLLQSEFRVSCRVCLLQDKCCQWPGLGPGHVTAREAVGGWHRNAFKELTWPKWHDLVSLPRVDLFAVLVYFLYVNIPCDFVSVKQMYVGRDSSVGIATKLRAGRSWDRIPGGEIFRSRPDRPWGPHSLLHNGYRVSFPGVKRPGRGVDHRHPSRATVKERIGLYLYSPSGSSWPVLG